MRYAIGLEYDGCNYYGWQRQNVTSQTVQENVEAAISKIANEQINIVCAGRTDRGVHATQQVVHFDTQAVREDHQWLLGTNRYLPDDINMTWIKAVDEEFHARFSATARRYCYVIYNHAIRSSILHNKVTLCRTPLDETLMHGAAQQLIGEHDFSSFRASQCEAKSPVRHIHHIRVWRQRELIIIDIKANAFLQHMVRNIAGVLMAVGSGEQSPQWVTEVLAAKNRCDGGVTAEPDGLYFIDVIYPELFNVATQALYPLFIAKQEED